MGETWQVAMKLQAYNVIMQMTTVKQPLVFLQTMCPLSRVTFQIPISCRLRRRAREGKKLGDTPDPGRRTAVPLHPLLKSYPFVLCQSQTAFQTCTVLSQEQEAIRLLSGDQATVLTLLECPE